MLRRLASFAGTFILGAAIAILADANLGPHDVAEGIANLVGKSLVSVDIGAPIANYRLLDTTRAYALEKLGESG